MKTLLTLLLLTTINIAYAAICPPNIIDTTPDSRYTNNNNGTITDNKTKLVWKQCSEGQTWEDGSPDSCTGTASTKTWQNALILADNATFTNNSNWQLPNIKQLKSIVAYHCYNPSINETYFPNTPNNNFWSSSPDASNKSGVPVVNFQLGDRAVYNRNQAFNVRVRLVRPMY